MKKEYEDKMTFYQTPEYEALLKEKNVLDARQFLHSSILCLHYALISQKMYETIAQESIEYNGNPLYNEVEILGWKYNVKILHNKLTSEWISYISRSSEFLSKYINCALNLPLPLTDVTIKKIQNALHGQEFKMIRKALKQYGDDIVLDYIHKTNNYFKHSCNLFGSYSSQELFYKKDKNITIPLFYYKEKDYPSKKIKDLFAYYETIIGIYIDILDSIDLYLKNIPPINNRYYVAGYIIDGITTREARLTNELVLHVNRIDEKTKYWIDNFSFEEGKLIEIMQYYDMSVGQHYEWIKEIDVFQDNKKVGVLKSIEHKIDWSILTYRKYKYHAEK